MGLVALYGPPSRIICESDYKNNQGIAAMRDVVSLNSSIVLSILLCFPQLISAGTVIPGGEVDISTEREAPISIDEETLLSESVIPPFGKNLFDGKSFSAEGEDGLNPEYIIQPGDRITIRIWGATSVNEVAVVDAQGNIFLPEVGPVRVEGVKNGGLSKHIEGALKRVFTQNINVYTNLEATTPVLVFVTGFVNRPGSYAGVASDSLLFFLERAGGIDLERGSFRDISILRDGEVIAKPDLYNFLFEGKLPRPQFTDGDTILVERRGASITAEGAIRNSFSFELKRDQISGKQMIDMSRPYPNAHYATVLGTRNDQPISLYITLQDLSKLDLMDGDQVIFEVDQVHDNILIRVEGSHIGQSRFSVPRNSHLLDVLEYIKVDSELSDINSISIHRESLRVRQKKAIEQSLQRLEAAILSRTTITEEGAKIKAVEAQIISDFVNNAKEVDPKGILVVSKNNEISNVLLQPDDVITIPEKTNVIQVSGEVMVPQALVYEPEYNLTQYIQYVGGYSEHANKAKHMILRRNGEVIPVFGNANDIVIKPGDEIVALPKIPSKSIDIIRMVADMMFKIAATAAIFINI